MKLNPILESFFAAKNRHDSEAVAALFAPDGMVEDEGQTIVGREAVRVWSDASVEKYRPVYEPKSVEGSMITATVSGTFDGSPVDLDFVFTIEGEWITSLVVP